MGHDHHFLSRLDRVNDTQVDLALALYRDHEAVEKLLQATSSSFAAPHSAERAMEATAHLRELVSARRRPSATPRPPGPNEPCSCGSGRKYKKCCGEMKSAG